MGIYIFGIGLSEISIGNGRRLIQVMGVFKISSDYLSRISPISSIYLSRISSISSIYLIFFSSHPLYVIFHLIDFSSYHFHVDFHLFIFIIFSPLFSSSPWLSTSAPLPTCTFTFVMVL